MTHDVMEDIERVITRIWSDTLGAEVARDDLFDECGGHSLLAGVIVAQVERACNVELPLEPRFRLTTIAELTRQVHVLLDGRAHP